MSMHTSLDAALARATAVPETEGGTPAFCPRCQVDGHYVTAHRAPYLCRVCYVEEAVDRHMCVGCERRWPA